LIILKDVVATGITEAYLISQFRELGAKEIRFVALVDLPEQRKLDIPVDYQLLTPKKPGTFVGYGLKLDGLYGNLPYLGRVVGS
jgi:hypoxanthine-guanine phosphoribosyltransferase